jgi:hypothetical protein
MSLGRAEVVRSDYGKAVQARIAKYKRAYEAAREAADNTMQSMAPEDTGALKASSKATMLPDGLGFVMRSFGNESMGKAYAKFVNSGHHIAKKDGTIVFIPAVPFFSQAEADARATLREHLRSSR